MIHCKKCLAVFTNSVGSGTVLCNGCQPNGDPDIFDTQPTCGELSCDECNERYAKVVARIKALEDALRNMLTDYWCTHSCIACEGMGNCPGRESCQCSYCKGKALITTEKK